MIARIFAIIFCLLCAAPAAQAEDMARDVSYAAPTYHAQIESVTPLVKGQLAQLSLVLTDEKGDPVSLGRLDVLQGEKIHLLSIDETLMDYQHLLPRPAGTTGHYIFSFVPKTARNYKIFVNIKPKGKPAQDIPVLLKGADPCTEFCVNRESGDRTKQGGYSIYVSLNRDTVHVGEDVIGRINILDAGGVPANNLEPLMDSFAYITGFYDDFSTISHIETVTRVPQKASARTGSPLLFVLHPLRKGYFKYFILYKQDGQERAISMGVRVVNPGESLPNVMRLISGAPPQK